MESILAAILVNWLLGPIPLEASIVCRGAPSAPALRRFPDAPQGRSRIPRTANPLPPNSPFPCLTRWRYPGLLRALVVISTPREPLASCLMCEGRCLILASHTQTDVWKRRARQTPPLLTAPPKFSRPARVRSFPPRIIRLCVATAHIF